MTNDHLDDIERFFLERDAAVAHENCPLTDISLITKLSERQYRPLEYSNALYQTIDVALRKVAPIGETVRVRLIERGEEPMWAEIAARGWLDVALGIEDFLLGLAAIIPDRPNSFVFLAEIQGQPIAAASLSLFEGVALMGGVCTVPEWRKHGAQQALLAARLRYGADHGCDRAMVVTEPGSTSQRNSERHGFRVAYTCTKWQLPNWMGN